MARLRLQTRPLQHVCFVWPYPAHRWPKCPLCPARCGGDAWIPQVTGAPHGYLGRSAAALNSQTLNPRLPTQALK
eukprot:9809032-Lingulodinium_polyedra.AAC.1